MSRPLSVWRLALIRFSRAVEEVAQVRNEGAARDGELFELARARVLELGQRRLVAELREKNTELAQMNFTISHDLRNPLVTIRSFLGLVEKDWRSGDAASLEKDLGHVSSAAEQMERMRTHR